MAGRVPCRRERERAVNQAMRNADPDNSPSARSDRPRIVLWGTFDLSKPRVRIMREALRQRFEVVEIGDDVWRMTRDKSQISRLRLAAKALQTILAWPALLFRYVRAPAHDAVVVGYFGLFDVFAIAIPARLRGVPIIWDAFLSVYDTVVDDRAMVRKGAPVARILHAIEKLACRVVSLVVLDTRAQADYFVQGYRLPHGRVTSVMVGCEDAFPALPSKVASAGKRPVVLFYGQFIPLHGIGTIVDAACLSGAERFDWRIIGTGQEAPRIASQIEEAGLKNLQWTEWVEYERLAEEIAGADICLGVFGTSAKAGRVIPNKVFQIIATGKPLVTRDGPGMRELLRDGDKLVTLVPAGDPQALLNAVDKVWQSVKAKQALPDDQIADRFAFAVIAQDWSEVVDQAIRSRGEAEAA